MKNFNERLKVLEMKSNNFIPDNVRKEVEEMVEKYRQEYNSPDYNSPENVAKRKAEDEIRALKLTKLLAEIDGSQISL